MAACTNDDVVQSGTISPQQPQRVSEVYVAALPLLLLLASPIYRSSMTRWQPLPFDIAATRIYVDNA